MKYNLIPFIALIILLFTILVTAEDSFTNTYDSTDDMNITTKDDSLYLDSDKDGIRDFYDNCPNTPTTVSIIQKTTEPIYYLGKLVDRTGCTCKQLKEKYLFEENVCVFFECFEDSIFELTNRPYIGEKTICPEDICNETNHAFYDYPEEGYPRCSNFRLVDYDCTPEIHYNYSECGYEEEYQKIIINDSAYPNYSTLNETNQSLYDENESNELDFTEQTISNSTILNTTNITNNTSILIINNSDIMTRANNTNNSIQNNNLTTKKERFPLTIGEKTNYSEIKNLQIPKLEGKYKKNIRIEEANISFAFPRIVIDGEKAYFEFLLVQPTKNRIRFDLEISVDKVKLSDSNFIPERSYNDDDGITEFIIHTSLLPNNIGEHEILLEIKQKNELLYNFEGAYEVRASQVNVPVLPVTTIVTSDRKGELRAEDYAFAKAIHEELKTQEATEKDFEKFNEEIAEATKKINIVKEKEYSNETNTTKFTVQIEPKKNKELRNITLIEYIPKEIAESAQNIEFNIQPTKILADDPLIMWHFSAVDERINLEYKVKGDVQVTGNTIVTLEETPEKKLPWKTILPVIIIPLLILLLVIMPHMHKMED